MRDHPPPPIRLSETGEQRRRRIGQDLIRRARARRSGRAVLAGAACLTLLAGAAVLARALTSPTPEQPRRLAHHDPRPAHPPAPPDRPSIREARITIFTNEPIASTPCGALASDTAPATQVPVCILNDDQLISALSTTGESYGIVRIGGKTMVVSNSSH
jgi:hypothetical protein